MTGSIVNILACKQYLTLKYALNMLVDGLWMLIASAFNHLPLRQTMVTGTNPEKQLPIFPCSDPQENIHGAYLDTVLSFTTYFA